MREVLVLALADGLTVTLPIERARELLRPLLSETELRRVQETLRHDHAPSDDAWLKRRKDTQTKLAGGDPLGLAEVVRDGALRERRLIAKGNGSHLSPSEIMTTKAMTANTRSVAVRCGVESRTCPKDQPNR